MQPAKGYNSLQTIYIALLTGQVAFLLISLYLIRKGIFRADQQQLENIFMPLLVVLALTCIVTSNRIYKTRIKKLTAIHALGARFTEYRATSLVRWALLEAPCLFALVCFLLTSNYLFLLIASLVLFVFGSTAPAKNKVAREMGITADELDTIS